ncbi:SprT family protein [Sporosarcina sp. ANT_H38]|uniref:SprT family protein n=1 Tax=Sporosarcina sp. ANT_H38 TaxID=2597358 RepID=UPI0011F21FE0|nr:SprT family protein [Sporosarcina sp. ANT_H38]KAA0948408.1 SprT family protein [Sporosarcina sp. ANT_H38]
MTDEGLQALIENVSLNAFGKPFIHIARFNKRLRTTGGRYMLSDHSIQINPLVLEVHGTEELVGVIKHELCHYHLHIEGRGYRHRDADFRDLLKYTGSPRFCRPLTEGNKRVHSMHVYECVSCKTLYNRRRRMNVRKYRCGKCAGQIVAIQPLK